MKITLSVLLVATFVVAAWAEKKVATNAPPAKDVNKKPPSPVGGRHRRATCGTPTRLPQQQATEIIKAHNTLRAKETSANMIRVQWSDEMAAMAQIWADQCTWGHGMLYDCNNNRIGQNLYLEASNTDYPVLNMTFVAESWWNEKFDYDFPTGKCVPGKLCGHYTQLVGAKSFEVGCAFTKCPTITVGTEVWKNALMVACDYTPPGNVVGEAVYKLGTTCSFCDSDGTGKGYKCVDNLCTPCSPATDATCKCGTPLTCVNGATWSTSTCSCQCPKGFYGLTCEKACSCADATEDCWAYVDYCKEPDYSEFMNDNCMKTCGFTCNLPAACS